MTKPTNNNQSHDDDEDSIADFDKSWEGLVLKAYHKARAIFERNVETEGKVCFYSRV